jgi:hypothetical protein
MSTIPNLLILDTLTYSLTLMIIGLEGEQPLKDFLSLIILVLTSLAIPIAPPTLQLRDLWDVRVYEII